MDETLGYVNGVAQKIKVTAIDTHGHVLRDDAAMSFARMASAAAKDKVTLHVNSAFRDHAKQQHLYELYMTAMRGWEAGSKLDPQPTPAARPGFSKHESGVAVDIEAPLLVFTWLKMNAAEFKFYNTVWNEPWHWEYKP
jgi:D-alanyl-D-alanine carboxypeptidase